MKYVALSLLISIFIVGCDEIDRLIPERVAPDYAFNGVVTSADHDCINFYVDDWSMVSIEIDSHVSVSVVILTEDYMIVQHLTENYTNLLLGPAPYIILVSTDDKFAEGYYSIDIYIE